MDTARRAYRRTWRWQDGDTGDDQAVVLRARSHFAQGGGYNHANRLRTESASEAKALDDRILSAWDGHPHRIIVESSTDFIAKAARVIELIRAELPQCCSTHDLKAGFLQFTLAWRLLGAISELFVSLI